MRTASSMFATMLLVAGSSILAANEKATLTTTDAADFNPGGRIEINDSFGDLHIVGWNQPRVEILVTRATQKRYGAASMPTVEDQLRRITVQIQQPSPDRLVISTEFPERNLFTRPLRGKSNLELSYEVRVPRQTDLHVKHDIGDVRIEDIAGDVNATCRIGEINIVLPNGIAYSIDAKTKIGNVDSAKLSVSRESGTAGETSGVYNTAAERRLYARVGIGDITIRPPDAGTLFNDDDEVHPLEVEVI